MPQKVFRFSALGTRSRLQLQNLGLWEGNIVTESQVSRNSVMLGWAICGLGALFYCYEYLLRIEPSVMVPELMRKFQLSAEEFGFITSLYYIAYTPMQIIVGLMTDIMGPRKMLTVAVLICALGSLLFGSTDQVWLAGTGRFLVGFGSAFAFVGVLKLAAIWLPSSRFALFAGLATALGMVGAMMGVVQLSSLVQSIGWEKTVFVGTIIGFMLVPVVWLVVRDTHGDPEYMEPLERVTLWEALRGVWAIAKNIQMWYAGLIGLALYMSLSVFGELWGVDFLEKTYGYTPHEASYANAMVFAGWLVGAPFAGWFSDLLRSRRMTLIIGCVLSGLCFISLLYLTPHSPYIVCSLIFLFGFFSSTEIVCFAIGRENCPFHMSGSAVSFVNMLVMFGGMLFSPLVGKLLDHTWSGQMVDGVRSYTAANYQVALVMIPLCLLAALFLSFMMRESYGAGEDA